MAISKIGPPSREPRSPLMTFTHSILFASRRIALFVAAGCLSCATAALADQAQNNAVNGSASDLLSAGYNLTGTGINVGITEAGNAIPNVNGLATPGSNLPNGNADLPAG